MATLKKRRGYWYARVLWYKHGETRQIEKQVPLKTNSKVEARVRLAIVNKVENDIKEGIAFSFPWLNNDGSIKVCVFRFKDAVNQWMLHRKKNKIRKKTLEINQLALNYFMDCNGANRPLSSIGNPDIANYIDYLDARGNSDTTINIHLRTIKAMLRHYLKIGKLDHVALIEQRKIAKTEPIYISDHEFHSLMKLDQLVGFYKRVFLFYRETGIRLREPFTASLNGDWIDIPPESKTHSMRSIQLSEPLKKIFIELKVWYDQGYGSALVDPGGHISKMFKKSLRKIGADEAKHFHSLRHTFAVRRLLMNTSIYDVKLMMGHASVTTTEVYSNMNLKRVAQDFPTLVSHFGSEPAVKDTKLKDIKQSESTYLTV